MNQDNPDAQCGEQCDVVNQIIKMGVRDGIATKDNNEGTASVCLDIRRSIAKPVYRRCGGVMIGHVGQFYFVNGGI